MKKHSNVCTMYKVNGNNMQLKVTKYYDNAVVVGRKIVIARAAETKNDKPARISREYIFL